MTLTMLFDGTQHVVIASGANSFLINKLHLPIRSTWDREKLTEVFTE
ncbi:MAG: hypothetical protein U0586_09590 [Candidatus Brocadiaceae bacterium]